MNSFDPRRILPPNWQKLTGLSPNVPLGQPFFRAVNTSNPLTLTQSVAAKMNWDSVTVDTGGYWDATNKRYLPKVAGRYQVICAIKYNCTGSTALNGVLASVDVRKNGSTYSINEVFAFIAKSGSSQVQANIAVEVQLNGTTDYIETWAYTDDSNAAAFASGSDDYMHIHYLGP